MYMRETGWSPIYCRRRFLRGVISSKLLLLHAVMCDDNVANNGGILSIIASLITSVVPVRHQKYNSILRYLRTRDNLRQYRGKSI